MHVRFQKQTVLRTNRLQLKPYLRCIVLSFSLMVTKYSNRSSSIYTIIKPIINVSISVSVPLCICVSITQKLLYRLNLTYASMGVIQLVYSPLGVIYSCNMTAIYMTSITKRFFRRRTIQYLFSLILCILVDQNRRPHSSK